MRSTRAVVAVTALALSALVLYGCGDSPRAEDPSIPPVRLDAPQSPGSQLPREGLEAIRSYLVGFDQPNIQIKRAAVIEDSAFALFTYRKRGVDQLAFASIDLSGVAVLKEIRTGIWSSLILMGDHIEIEPLRIGRIAAYGGLVGDAFSRLESLDGFGRVLSEDSPETGFTLLVVPTGAAIRGMSGERVIYLAPDLLDPDPPIPTAPTSSREAVAEDFVDALVKKRTGAAAALLDSTIEEGVLLPTLIETLAGEELDTDGASNPFGYQFRSSDGDVVLDVYVSGNQDTAKIWNVVFRRPPG